MQRKLNQILKKSLKECIIQKKKKHDLIYQITLQGKVGLFYEE